MQKSHMIPKPSRCRTHNCKTIVYGGHFCTLCSGSTFNLNPEIEKPAKARPVGLAVVCLMIVFSLVATYAQKHVDERAEQSLVAD